MAGSAYPCAMVQRTWPDEETLQWTPRQKEVLDLILRGRTNGQIAEALGVSLAGAKWHVSELISKLGVSSREEVAEYWRETTSLGARLSRGLHGFGLAVALKSFGSAVGATIAVASAGVIVFVIANYNGSGDNGGPAALLDSEARATATPYTPPTSQFAEGDVRKSCPGGPWSEDVTIEVVEQGDLTITITGLSSDTQLCLVFDASGGGLTAPVRRMLATDADLVFCSSLPAFRWGTDPGPLDPWLEFCAVPPGTTTARLEQDGSVTELDLRPFPAVLGTAWRYALVEVDSTLSARIRQLDADGEVIYDVGLPYPGP